MDSMDDLDNLMDNFDIKTFWNKRKLGTILAIYAIQSVVVGILLTKAVLDASEAGAVPKGMALDSAGRNIVR